ncbi:hypothetical protein PsorP6_016592 [Peronosclerospora sorghi]|uniref:Uncharacterized protein n=1 Tax=Peronosclerospora sorghi TaxID=230839 RepID=A0ACC0VPN0_9STRA|nr:hypothetical protein PsorP6_016592 [Peronosclerospora sorghi]
MVSFFAKTNSILGPRVPSAFPREDDPLTTLDQLNRLHDRAERALTETIFEYGKLDHGDVDISHWKSIRSKRGVRLLRGHHVGRQTLLMCVGTLHARFEDVLEGLYCDNTDELILLNAIMCPRLTKSTVVHVVQKKTTATPYTFTGIKAATFKSSIGCTKEWCYFDKLGFVRQLAGKQLAYHIMQSVDRPHKTATKTLQASLCYVFEELETNLVGVYMRGEVYDATFSYFATMSMSDVLLAFVNAVEYNRAKKFSLKAAAAQLADRNERTMRRSCNVCKVTASFFAHLTRCAGCHKYVCKRCRFKEYILTRTTVSTENCPKRLDFCRECISVVNALSIKQLRIEAKVVNATDLQGVNDYSTLGMINEETEDAEKNVDENQQLLMSFVRNISTYATVLSSQSDFRASTLSSIGILSSSDEECELSDLESEDRDVLHSSRLKSNPLVLSEKTAGDSTRRSCRFSTTSTASCGHEEDDMELYQSAIMTKLQKVSSQAEETLHLARKQSLVARSFISQSKNVKVEVVDS